MILHRVKSKYLSNIVNKDKELPKSARPTGHFVPMILKKIYDNNPN